MIPLKIDAKFGGKPTCSFKNDMNPHKKISEILPLHSYIKVVLSNK